jgi:hypothetical protein
MELNDTLASMLVDVSLDLFMVAIKIPERAV